MYKYLGLGLMALVAVLMIPAQNVVSFTEQSSMYGMAILAVKDSSGNTLMTNTVHNEVLDVGTGRMLANMFEETGNIAGAINADQADGICLTDAVGFDPTGANDAMTSTTFSGSGGGGTNGLDTGGLAGASCITVVWTITAGTTVTGATTNFQANNVNVPDTTTITGFAVCDLDGGADFCVTGTDIVSAIATSVTLGAGETVDITYVLILD